MKSTRRKILQSPILALAGLTMLRRYAWGEASARRQKPLRILILGGTGFTGPHQVRYALARGHKITLFNRGRRPHEWPGEVEELVGDRNTGDLKELEGREWDVCIDNPTTLPFWVRDVGQVLRGKVKQYIFISTVSVYADDLKAADESAPTAKYSGKDAMAETIDTLHANVNTLFGPLKALSEQESQKQFPGIATIIRPGLIVGPGDESDRFTYWPVRLSRGGDVLAPGDGNDPVQFVDGRDLAEWTIRVAESRTLGIFNATGPSRPLSMRGMLQGIATAIHSSSKIIWVPTDFLRSANVALDGDIPVWEPGQGDTAGAERRIIRKALAAGLTFRPLAQTAVDALAWFRQQSAERQAKLKAGLTSEREQELLAGWKEAARERVKQREGA
jgi:2'-hydroxyisoflavone reductase